MTTKNKKHCKRHDGHDRALSTLTHITPSVQSRSFNKLWNLGRTSVRFCLAKFTKSTEWPTDNVRQWSNSGPILLDVTSLENPCISLNNFDIILQRAGSDWQGELFESVQLVPKMKKNQRLSLDRSECMMAPHMFENSVITKVGNVDIPGYQDSPPTDCPPRGQSWGGEY